MHNLRYWSRGLPLRGSCDRCWCLRTCLRILFDAGDNTWNERCFLSWHIFCTKGIEEALRTIEQAQGALVSDFLHPIKNTRSRILAGPGPFYSALLTTNGKIMEKQGYWKEDATKKLKKLYRKIKKCLEGELTLPCPFWRFGEKIWHRYDIDTYFQCQHLGGRLLTKKTGKGCLRGILKEGWVETFRHHYRELPRIFTWWHHSNSNIHGNCRTVAWLIDERSRKSITWPHS